jgi:hypothetical protein
MSGPKLPALTEDRYVALQFDAGVSPEERRTPPSMCIVGIVPPDAPWMADVHPECLLRDTRFRDPDFSVEHARLSSLEGVEALPGLAGSAPSRVRDAVNLARASGADEVDVLLARVNGARPWEFDRPDIVDALDPFLNDMLGTTMVFPDLGGPVSRRPGPDVVSEARMESFLTAVRRFAPRWTEHYQTALLDAPPVSGELEEHMFRGLVGTDAALCRFVHDDFWGPVHGWRSAAAVTAGLLAMGELTGGLEERTVTLPPGRDVRHGRRSVLSMKDLVVPAPTSSAEYVQLQVRRGVATVRSEPTFRQPLGSWTVTALRTVKALHWRMIETAQRFVFDKVHEAQAASLADALGRAMYPFYSTGVVTGPDGRGVPDIRGGVDRNPANPSLFADVTGVLQPWSQRVIVRVGIRPGAQPSLEVR